MSQIILIEDRKELNDLLEINLVGHLDVEVLLKKNSFEAIDLLDILPDVSLVICRDIVGNDKTAEKIIGFINKKQFKVSVIVLGVIPDGYGKKAFVAKDPRDWKEIVKTSANILNIKIDTSKVDSKYSQVPVRHFLHIENPCCDVFVRIKKTKEEDQYVKIVLKGNLLPRKKIERYIKQQLEYLYIQREMLPNLITFISNKLILKIDGLKKIDMPEAKMVVLSDSYTVAAQDILSIGFTSTTVQLTEKITKGIMEVFKDNSEMSTVLRKMINSKSSYIYKHGHMVSVVAIQILDSLGMKDKSIYKEVRYASFFHDITLINDEELSRITSHQELEAAKLEKGAYQLVINHAYNAVEMLKKYPNFPDRSKDMILHHHGSLDGKGFSSTDFDKFSDINKIFFISCEFAKEFLSFNNKKEKKLTPITDKLREKYIDPGIAKAITALEISLKEKGRI